MQYAAVTRTFAAGGSAPQYAFLFVAQIAPVAAQALQALAERLMTVCENPQQPGFNHFLFESVAALIRYGCEADPAMVVRFESSLFPAFEKVLQVGAAFRQRLQTATPKRPSALLLSAPSCDVLHNSHNTDGFQEGSGCLRLSKHW